MALRKSRTYEDLSQVGFTFDPSGNLFESYLTGLKDREPWFLETFRYLNWHSIHGTTRGLRDFEFDRRWLEVEAVFRSRRRIEFTKDEEFEATFPYVRLHEEFTSFIRLTSGDLRHVLGRKTPDYLELQYEHSQKVLNKECLELDDLLKILDEHWQAKAQEFANSES